MADTDQNKQSNKGQLSEIVGILKSANNIMVTVSKDPGVDQLAACIGLTLALSKTQKHATAVFSGQVPKLIDFLEPEKTLEKNTDSLRDFIISLDKSKADKLRYKVEDNVVRIFITPYKTSISEKDLDFSQGDFNIDAIVALGIKNRTDLDEAILAHGRILHDAKIIALSSNEPSEIGTINWTDTSASSISEMSADLIVSLDKKSLDGQIATAFLAGIVHETDRFKNEKSSPHTMSISGILMSAGASTQLVSSKLEEGAQAEEPEDNDDVNPDEDNNSAEFNDESSLELPESDVIPEAQEDEPEEEPAPEPKKDDGVIEIDHDDDQIHIDDAGRLRSTADMIAEEESRQAEEARKQEEVKLAQAVDNQTNGTDNAQEPQSAVTGGSNMVYQPPTFGGQLTANSEPQDRQYNSTPDPALGSFGNANRQTLSDLEKSVNSPHVSEYQPSVNNTPSTRGRTINPLSPDEAQQASQAISTPTEPQIVSPDSEPQSVEATVAPPPSLDYAQSAVERAVNSSNEYRPEPIQALGAQPLGVGVNNQPDTSTNTANNPSGPPPPPVPPPMIPS